MDTSDFIAGGYLVTKFVDSTSYNRWMRDVLHTSEDLLPDKILSVGMCGAPHSPIFGWVSSLENDYEQFGIPVRLPELGEWANERFGTSVGYPDIFFYLSTAREYVRRFTSAPDIQILGMAVHVQDLPLIAKAELLRPTVVSENEAAVAGFSRTGFAQALRLAEHYTPGEVLGFDVICCDYNIDHSWHCNGLAVDALREFHFRPNQFGLIDDKANADKLVHWIQRGESKPEAGVWLPVLVSRYP